MPWTHWVTANAKSSCLSEIGESFGVSKERIRQIEAKALGKLKHVLAEHGEDATALLSNDLQA